MFQSVRPETEISGRVRITGKGNKFKQIKPIDSPQALLMSREPLQDFGNTHKKSGPSCSLLSLYHFIWDLVHNQC